MDNPFNSLEAAAWGGFLSTHGRLSKRLEDNLRTIAGLSHPEYEVLLRLFMSDGGQLRIQSLAETSVLSHSGTSRLVNRLEEAGFCERTNAAEDRRGSYAVLTDQGREQFMIAAKGHAALVHQIFLNRFSPKELELLGSFWSRFDDL